MTNAGFSRLSMSAAWCATAACLLLLLAGCATPAARERPVDPDVARAARLFEEERYTDAIIACVEIHRRDPLTPGLAELQGRIMNRLAELRQASVKARQEPSDKLAIADLDRQGILPDTYRAVRHVVGETAPIHTLPPAMQEVLDRPVTIDLQDVGLSEIVAEIGRSENINIVADAQLGAGTLTIQVKEVPLGEVLEYIGRNLGVTFAVGRNIIWVTQNVAAEQGAPLYTRIYRLRRGLSAEELEGGPDSLGIIDAVNRFVPPVPGADILFNTKAHAILAKNTRENLTLIEDIIEVLDVRPPQVLIEARFISTGITDLREVGVDWLLNSPVKIGEKGRVVDGTVIYGNRMQIDSGAAIEYSPFAGAAQGMNFTYQGVLTDPAFQAVVHALETTGKSRTLSVPRVTTVNNREASMRVGEDFRFFEEYETEEVRTGTTPEGRDIYQSRLVPTGTPTLEELGIELVVTPTVGADLATIGLKLAPQISEFVRWEYYETATDDNSSYDYDNNGNGSVTNAGLSMIKLPIFRRNLVNTEVLVRSGETVIMGGLVTSSRVKSREGTPILSWLPLVGQFFRHDIYEDISQNLLIFVTATLISDVGEELIPLGPPEPLAAGGKVELGGGAPAVATAAPPAEAVAPPPAEAAPPAEAPPAP